MDEVVREAGAVGDRRPVGERDVGLGAARARAVVWFTYGKNQA